MLMEKQRNWCEDRGGGWWECALQTSTNHSQYSFLESWKTQERSKPETTHRNVFRSIRESPPWTERTGINLRPERKEIVGLLLLLTTEGANLFTSPQRNVPAVQTVAGLPPYYIPREFSYAILVIVQITPSTNLATACDVIHSVPQDSRLCTQELFFSISRDLSHVTLDTLLSAHLHLNFFLFTYYVFIIAILYLFLLLYVLLPLS